jgi:lipopolysaccharide export system protein LptA
MIPSGIYADSSKEKMESGSPKPMVVKSKTLEVNNDKKIVFFKGDVNASKDDFVINCQEMLVYYASMPGGKNPEETKTKIDKIVATGRVQIERAQGGIATAEKAVFYQKEEKLVLTGNPAVKQGNDSIKGDRIILFLAENRSVVESSGDAKVTAIIFPNDKKK